VSTLRDQIADILSFRDARDWRQFHTPRNLAAAIAIEAAELQETMLWKTDREVQAILDDPTGRGKVAREMADIFIFSSLLCHEAGIDPEEAIKSKLAENAQKYPVNLAKGSAAKYTELEQGEKGG
jgi:NTP pyrophosphatase (non-canonical NTP hydrolase)